MPDLVAVALTMRTTIHREMLQISLHIQDIVSNKRKKNYFIFHNLLHGKITKLAAHRIQISETVGPEQGATCRQSFRGC